MILSQVGISITPVLATAGVAGIVIGKVTSVVLNFLELTDTPSSYSGFGGDCVLVNSGETGLTFGIS